jgi:hypothetical protein
VKRRGRKAHPASASDEGVRRAEQAAPGDPGKRPQLIALGAAEVVVKPFDFGKLAETLRGMLKG